MNWFTNQGWNSSMTALQHHTGLFNTGQTEDWCTNQNQLMRQETDKNKRKKSKSNSSGTSLGFTRWTVSHYKHCGSPTNIHREIPPIAPNLTTIPSTIIMLPTQSKMVILDCSQSTESLHSESESNWIIRYLAIPTPRRLRTVQRWTTHKPLLGSCHRYLASCRCRRRASPRWGRSSRGRGCHSCSGSTGCRRPRPSSTCRTRSTPC